MEPIRIGNPVVVKWTFKHTDGTPFPVADYSPELFFYTGRGKTKVTDTTVLEATGNLLVWHFNADAQPSTGVYSLALKVYLQGNLVGSFDCKDAFMLTSTGAVSDNPIEVDLVSKCDYITLNEAIQNARLATDNAVEAAQEAHEEAGRVADAIDTAIAAASAANDAAGAANEAAGTANTAAGNADTKAALADAAAENANTKAGLADTAAQNADHVASTIAIEVGDVETGAPGSDVEVEGTWNPTTHKLSLDFSIPQGNPGTTLEEPIQIVDDLTSTDGTTSVLSANQGRVLKGMIDANEVSIAPNTQTGGYDIAVGGGSPANVARQIDIYTRKLSLDLIGTTGVEKKMRLFEGHKYRLWFFNSWAVDEVGGTNKFSLSYSPSEDGAYTDVYALTKAQDVPTYYDFTATTAYYRIWARGNEGEQVNVTFEDITSEELLKASVDANATAINRLGGYIYYSPATSPTITINDAKTSMTITFPADENGYMFAMGRNNKFIVSSRHNFSSSAEVYTINKYQVLLWDTSNGTISTASYDSLQDDKYILLAGFSGSEPVGLIANWLLSQMYADKIDKSAIVNNLTSGGSTSPLSAEQGKILFEKKGLSMYYSYEIPPRLEINGMSNIKVTFPVNNGGYFMALGGNNKLIGSSRHNLPTTNEESYTINRYQVLKWDLSNGTISTTSFDTAYSPNEVVLLSFSGGAIRGLLADFLAINGYFNERGIVDLNKDVETRLYSAIKKKGFYGTYANATGILSLLHFSDLHGSIVNLKRIIEFKNKYSSYISDMLHTGDCVTSYFEDDNPFASITDGNKVLNVIGNHDCWQEGHTYPTPYDATAEQAYTKFIAPFISAWGVTSAGVNKCYYYKDYTKANVRMIVLDALHYDSTQEDWFESVLASAKTAGYSILAVNHYPAQKGLTKIECGGFNSYDEELAEVVPSANQMERLPDSAYSIVDDFINGGGNFICWIGGHTHLDYFGLVPTHTNQLQIMVDKAGDYDAYVEEARIVDTKSQDAFNIFVIDTNLGLIKVVRVGCDSDMFEQSKKSFCYDYINKTLVYNQ